MPRTAVFVWKPCGVSCACFDNPQVSARQCTTLVDVWTLQWFSCQAIRIQQYAITRVGFSNFWISQEQRTHLACFLTRMNNQVSAKTVQFGTDLLVIYSTRFVGTQKYPKMHKTELYFEGIQTRNNQTHSKFFPQEEVRFEATINHLKLNSSGRWSIDSL